jgi:deazaflavin-dependent oxidoreductase (nitroreductase family)
VTSLAELPYCYLTTTGRVTGRPHRRELWFAMHDGDVYILSGGGHASDWVRNLEEHPEVSLEIGDETRRTVARVVSEPEQDGLARRLLLEKYARPGGDDLTDWGRTALPIVIDWS